MTHAFRAFLAAVLVLGALLRPIEAQAQKWGVAFGLSRILEEEWALGYRSTFKAYWPLRRRVEWGIESGVEFQRPASEAPRCCIDWHSSGAAWLFEVGPAIRMTTRPLNEAGEALVFFGGSGMVFVASDAELIEHAVVPDPILERKDLIESRVAPYLSVGLSALSAGERGRRLELSAGARLFIVEPNPVTAVTVELGVLF